MILDRENLLGIESSLTIPVKLNCVLLISVYDYRYSCYTNETGSSNLIRVNLI